MQPFQMILKSSRSLAAECLALLMDFVHRSGAEVFKIPLLEEKSSFNSAFVHRESENMFHPLNYCCAAITTYCSQSLKMSATMLRLLTTLEAWILFSSLYVQWWLICHGEAFDNNYIVKGNVIF